MGLRGTGAVLLWGAGGASDGWHAPRGAAAAIWEGGSAIACGCMHGHGRWLLCTPAAGNCGGGCCPSPAVATALRSCGRHVRLIRGVPVGDMCAVRGRCMEKLTCPVRSFGFDVFRFGVKLLFVMVSVSTYFFLDSVLLLPVFTLPSPFCARTVCPSRGRARPLQSWTPSTYRRPTPPLRCGPCRRAGRWTNLPACGWS